jgi:hypothetical protein
LAHVQTTIRRNFRLLRRIANRPLPDGQLQQEPGWKAKAPTGEPRRVPVLHLGTRSINYYIFVVCSPKMAALNALR